MNEECLTLTTYFGERDRTPRGLLADELLDVYGAHGVAASVLLRGTAGFGRLGHLNTDRLLSLSEDLPVISIAVDTRERIESMLEDVLAIKRRGLVTLERARLLSGELADVALPAQFAEGAKLTVFVGRRERVLGKPAFAAVCDLLHRRGVAGATVLLGVDGTTAGRRVRAGFFGANAEVPMIVVAVGSGDRIADVLAELGRLLDRPLVTLELVRICKRDGELLTTPNELPATDEHGLAIWRKLTVYSSQRDTHDGRPLHLEIIRRLRAADAAGATSVRGVWGFHGDHPPHGDRLLQLRRRVPVVTVAIDDPPRSARAFEIIDELTVEHGLVTSEMVPAAQAMGEHGHTGGVRLAKL
jgi:PII-like signaling protein